MATVGADPELCIKRGRETIPAGRVIPEIAGRTYDWGQVGRDGATNGPLELRPKPSFKPRDVVANLGRLLLKTTDVLPAGAGLAVGAYDEAIGGIGGHLHSWGRPDTRTKLDNSHNRGRICAGLSLLWALENYQAGRQRRGRNFGAVNDVRRGQPTWEFRTPSSDWLASPGLAYATLSFFQTLVDRAGEYARDLDELDNILADSLRYWQDANATFQERYRDRIVAMVKQVVRPNDLNTIMWHAERLTRLRGPDGLINIDIDKWGRKAASL